MKNLITLLLFLPLLVFAQTDSTIVSDTGGLFGISWTVIASVLGGLEIILRALPINQKWSILNAIGWIIQKIPNNTPK